ncbi:MAG: ADP-dependent NAD(P)H-hydrate dehydratase / NAD(P)H-hydrate epimerase [Thermomicrobiales bacterium]|nr:ADP-dependent NAD(P)H-hydrate dehydratase / NAD(P)H-hydrate epimerase [Thermomicrobiales bacterium]MEA2598269.1 ADP-dependent NAD(P)H-hydrate dehydratase / NAD(P)H-hydrate epimerase [Thermomicrobiales bacterium]
MTSTVTQDRPKLSAKERFVDEAYALSVLPRRSFGAHKWGIGGLVIIAGAPGYVGAAALCAMAAGRAGAGIMNLAVPRSAISTISTLVPEAAYIPMPEGDAESIARRAVESISEKLEKSKAVVVGPGLGEDDYAAELLSALFGLKSARRSSLGFGVKSNNGNEATSKQPLIGGGRPTVVDADALNWLAKQGEWWSNVAPGTLVLTPHVGEMARLLDCDASEVIAEPIKVAKEAASRWRQVVVLKYGHSVATDGSVALVADDAPVSLATGGSGDVFAGTIGAFLAQGLAPIDAAGLALFVGPRAARVVERRTGTLGLVASDLPLAIAGVLGELEHQQGEGNA